MRILVTRPEPDASTLGERLTDHGHQVFLEPLLKVDYLPVEIADIEEAQALIATSRNGLRALAASPAFEAAKELPVFTVGPGTAAEARALGMANVMAGPRSARELVPIIEEVAEVNAGPLVHLAGETLAFDLGAELTRLGFTILQPVVYRTVAVDGLSHPTIARIGGEGLDAVILLSPQTASIWTRLVRRHRLEGPVRRLLHVCLSDAVASRLEELGLPFMEVAASPNLEEILGLVGARAAQSK